MYFMTSPKGQLPVRMRLCDTLEGDWREPPKKDSGHGVGDHGRDKLSCIAFLLSGLIRGSLRLPSQSIYGSLGFIFLRSIAARPIGSTASRSDYSSTEC